jgi:hypothetical protein
VLAVALTAAVAVAQEPPSRPVSAAQPGSHGWPLQAPPSVPPAQPGGVPTDESRQPGAPAPSYPPPSVPAYPPVTADPYLYSAPAPAPSPVIPGSLDDQLMQEQLVRRGLRICTWQGTVISALPGGFLWTPPLASKREPRMQVLGSSLNNYAEDYTLDTSIGGTVGLVRAESGGGDVAYQFDLFGVVHTRLTPEDLIAADYRFGVPLTARWGPWHAKLAYEHTSAHLGDEFLRNFPQARIPGWAKDEVVVGVGRYFADQLRVYGQIGYAFFFDLPQPHGDSRWRFDYGAEWADLRPCGWTGTPFAAVHVFHRGDQDYTANFTAQVGWLWRNPFQRLATVRLFAEYYSGRSPFGQFDRTKENFYAVGLSCDY